MKKKHLSLLLPAICTFGLIACDDNTGSLGESAMPDKDDISIGTRIYEATSRSFLAGDSILAKTSTAYLGKYTDPLYGTFEADFLAQFHCVENFEFPANGVAGDTAVSAEIKLYLTSYFGDSINPCHLSVYPLTKILEDSKNYYTDITPEEYYDATLPPLASRPYTAQDKVLPDSITSASGYVPYISVPLPREFGTEIIRKYYETDELGNHIGKQYFANADAFINNICKGMYFKCDHGDGTILYILQAQLNITFGYYEVSQTTGKADSLLTVVAQFAGTQEVVQANHFQTDKETLNKLVEEDGSCTYLKTPAGIFTEITLPMEEIATNHIENGDTLNSVKLTLTRYNEGISDDGSSSLRMGIPKTLLMVRKKDMYTFFEKNAVIDNKTSYLTSFNENFNTYTFSNIAQLITQCAEEKAKSPDGTLDDDWNKVVLIPVVTTTDTSGNIITIRHNLNLTSARLMGGHNEENKLQVRITYSKFNN